MIMNAFIPEILGSYYLRPKRIVGLDITKSSVYGCQLLLSGSQCTIEKIYQEPINIDNSREYHERVSETIARITHGITGTYTLVSSLANNQMAYKEMVFPFTDRQKLAQVIAYQAAQVMPIDPAKAITEFIVTQSDKKKGTSTVQLATTYTNTVQDHLAYFSAEQNAHHKISLAIFDLYGLFLRIPSLQRTAQEATVLMQFDLNSITIACIIGTQLRLVRTLPKGIMHIAKQAAAKMDKTQAQAFEEFIRFGLSPNATHATQAVLFKELMAGLCDDIRFTLDSFRQTIREPFSYTHSVLVGFGADTPGVREYVQEQIGFACLFMPLDELFDTKQVRLANGVSVPQTHAIACALAIPNTITADFSFNRVAKTEQETRLFAIQFFTAITLLVTLLLLILGALLWQKYRLQSIAMQRETEIKQKLYALQLTSKKTVKTALDEATDNVDKEESLWFAFSRDRRFSFLETVQILSTHIDRKGLGLKLKKLVINTHEVILEGEVKDYEALKKLERALNQTNLFAQVPPLQNLLLNEKLTLKKNEEST
ncbi:MAG: hypothetical protein WCE21_03845 [Candidatus Babeliales bacterium]